MQATSRESAIRSTLPRLEDPLPVEEEECETPTTWIAPSEHVGFANYEWNQAHYHDDSESVSAGGSEIWYVQAHYHDDEPVPAAATNEIWYDDLTAAAAADNAYSESAESPYKRKFCAEIPEDLSHHKENLQVNLVEDNECDAEYSEDEEQEEEAPPPKKARTQNTPLANDQVLRSLPSPPADKASLKAEFLASLIKWPTDIQSTPSARKHFLETDPNVDHTVALDPTKVMCSGCKEYKMLDVRYQYYLTNWFAHRPRCAKLFNKWLASRG